MRISLLSAAFIALLSFSANARISDSPVNSEGFAFGDDAQCLSKDWYKREALAQLIRATELAYQAGSGIITDNERAFMQQEFEYRLNKVAYIGMTPSSCLTAREYSSISQSLTREYLNLSLTLSVLTANQAAFASEATQQAIRKVQRAF